VSVDPVEYWMSELSSRSDSTREKYSQWFARFTEWVAEDPAAMLRTRKENLRSEDIATQRRYESRLKAWVADLEDQRYSTSTQQVAWASVCSFFEMNYLPLRMRRGDYPEGDNLGYRAATRGDIARLLETDEDSRLQAMVLCLKDMGQRVSDLVRLRVGDVRRPLDAGEEYIQVKIVTRKNRVLASPCLGPEAVDSLKGYFEHREKGTEGIEPEDIEDDSPLFRAHVQEIRFLNRSSVSSAMNYLVERSGLAGEISAHSLRKFTETRLEAAGVNPNWVDQIIGHRVPGTRRNYSLPTDEELLEAYRTAYPQLRVFDIPASAEEMVRQSEVLKKQEEQLQSLKTDLALALGQRSLMNETMEKMRREIDELKAVVNQPANRVKQFDRRRP